MLKRTFTKEFKLGIYRQVLTGQVSKSRLKREHNLGNATLERWLEQYQVRGDDAFEGNWRHHKDPDKAHIRELEAALGRVVMENEFLKECLGNLPRLRAKRP